MLKGPTDWLTPMSKSGLPLPSTKKPYAEDQPTASSKLRIHVKRDQRRQEQIHLRCADLERAAVQLRLRDGAEPAATDVDARGYCCRTRGDAEAVGDGDEVRRRLVGVGDAELGQDVPFSGIRKPTREDAAAD